MYVCMYVYNIRECSLSLTLAESLFVVMTHCSDCLCDYMVERGKKSA